MSDEFVPFQAPVTIHMDDFVTPVPSDMNIHAPSRPRGKTKNIPDPDRFLMAAKQVVIDNYNNHRGRDKSGELTMNSVYIVLFSKVLGHWRALVGSPVARGLLWDVSYNGIREEYTVVCYKQLSSTKISAKENTE